MSIIRKVRRVENAFLTLEKEIGTFKEKSRISCLAGCGNCCKKPDIEASVLEFLPFAFYTFLNETSEEILSKLSRRDSSICVLFNDKGIDPITSATKGNCSEYQYRGLICRLFGFAATRDKHGVAKIATCKLIKEYHNVAYKEAETKILQGTKIPFYTDYYQKLIQIDFRLGQEFYPVNIAIQKAIEHVLSYYAYRPYPGKMKKKIA